MVRSVAAAVTGYLTIAVVSMVLWVLWPGAPARLTPDALRILSVLIGFVAALAGGAMAGVVARRHAVQHACLLALLITVLETLERPFSVTPTPVWYEVATLLFSVGGAILGGVLWHRRVRARWGRTRLHEGWFGAPSAVSREVRGSLQDRGRPDDTTSGRPLHHRAG